MYRLPAALERGDLVRVVAPSGCFDRDKLEAGAALLEAAGLRVAYDDGLFARERYLAGDDARRLAELEAALQDREARALWTARGGYGATRLLPSVSLDAVRVRAPWLIGFSDATAVHALWQRAGVASVHGANLTTFSSWSALARDELLGLLFAPAPRHFDGVFVCGGETVRGPLVGGNLTVLAAMAGTGALPAFDGAIVLVEDIGERPYRLDRSLTQLVQCGLSRAAGFVVGQLSSCEEPNADYTALDVVAALLGPLGKPVLAGLPLGHEPSSRAVLLGSLAELDVTHGRLVVLGEGA